MAEYGERAVGPCGRHSSRLVSLDEIMRLTSLNHANEVSGLIDGLREGHVKDRDLVVKYLTMLAFCFKAFGMTGSLAFTMDALGAINTMDEAGLPFDCAALKESLDVLAKVAPKEMRDTKLRYLRADKVALYEAEHPFGEQVADAFPTCNPDIGEAARCLALDRATACVFHLMRALEIVSRVLWRALDIKDEGIEQLGFDRILARVLKEIDTRQEAMRQQPKTAARDAEMEFYAEVAIHLRHSKDAWRNPIMHPRRTFTEEKAAEIYGAIKSLMQHMATQLAEPRAS